MFIMVDIEADGPIPGDYSMIEIGAYAVQEPLHDSFYSRLRPISDQWIPAALAVTGHTRVGTLAFDDPYETMMAFDKWLSKFQRPMFVSDNNGFDWMFVCWYFHHFLKKNPFGHSSTNLGSLYKGCVQNLGHNFKKFRKTKHTHNPLDDAKGNAEAMLTISKMYGLKLDWSPNGKKA